ncbi:MAG: hypothetical protein JXR73_20510 [Candidatus Omnitrophica bacterium]|nr:hypothetical protein [Candidatus Omnitrophota bacterium]
MMRKSMFILMMSICVAAAPVFAQVGIFDQTADWGGPDSPPQRGDNKVAGGASLSGDTYILQGNGDDIWENNDEGFFLYTDLSGSQTLTARVQWVDSGGGNEWAKAGVMIREEGARAGSRHFWLIFRSGTGAVLGDRTEAQWRDEADAASGNVEIRTADDQPVNEQGNGVWLRVTRIVEANLVVGQYSYDGVNWEAAGSRPAAFQDAAAYGLAITNHEDNELLAKAEFSDVSLEPAFVIVGSRSIAGPTYFNSNSFYKGGDEFTVTIPLTSTFADAQSIDVTESVPAGWTVSEISDGGAESSGVITWTGISVDNGQSASLSYKVTVPADPELTVSFSGSVNGETTIAGFASMAILGDSLGIFDAHGDIGAVAAAGDANYNENRQEYEVIGSGADIWGNGDEFHYVYKEISGPFSMSGLVEADPWESSDEWVKAGLMIRDNLNADSPHAFALIRPDFQIDFGWRSEKAASSSDSGLNTDAYGEFEVEKIGNKINLYYYASSTGEKTLGQTLTIPMEDPVYVGLAVTSHSDGNLSAGYFMDVELTEYAGYAVRELASQVLPFGGGTVAGNKVSVFITPGQTSSDTLTEELPAGCTAENIVVTNGQASFSGGRISWKLDSLTGQAEMTYDLVIPDSFGVQAAQFGGSFAGLSIEGDNGMYPVFFEIPFVDQVVTLDGVLEEGEYEGAYTETFDHADKTPPGVHWSPDGAEVDAELENATFHIFHNNDYIFVAIDVVDKIGLDFESGLPDIWKNDSTELHFDGNLSRSNPKDNNAYGFQAVVLGSGELVGGNDGPAMVELPNGGYASTNGAYWNAGAKVKDTEDGYIVEYAIDKSKILDPVDRTVIGFEILMNSGAGTGDRTGKWGYWNTSLGADETDAEHWDNEQGWAIVELVGGGGTGVSDWSLF